MEGEVVIEVRLCERRLSLLKAEIRTLRKHSGSGETKFWDLVLYAKSQSPYCDRPRGKTRCRVSCLCAGITVGVPLAVEKTRGKEENKNLRRKLQLNVDGGLGV